MGNIRTQLRRRRMQRWLRREAQLLAHEAEAFDCPAMRAEADRLVSLTGTVSEIMVLRTV